MLKGEAKKVWQRHYMRRYRAEGRNPRGKTLVRLEKAESWDSGQPEVREPVKASRVVVSVAFRRNALVPVLECAERLGKKLSEFIREAAIEKATGRGTLVYASGSTGTLWSFENMPTTTRAS